MVVDEAEPTVVPDASLKDMPSQRRLLLTTVLCGQRRLLPTIETNRLGLLALRSMLGVRF